MGVQVMLEEIGATYELIETSVDMKEPRPPEQLAINPNAWVPVLVWDGGAMYECAAITIYLCDRHQQAGLAPAANDATRALYLQSLVSRGRRHVAITIFQFCATAIGSLPSFCRT